MALVPPRHVSGEGARSLYPVTRMSDDDDPWGPDWNRPRRSNSGGSPASGSGAARRRGQGRGWRPGPLVVLVAMVPAVVATLALLGMGLRHGVAPWESCLGSLLLVLLPVAGLGALARQHRAALLLALLAWPGAVLWEMPRWLPGERAAGLSEGFAWLALPAGDAWVARAGRFGQRVGDLLGEDARVGAPSVAEEEQEVDGDQAEDIRPRQAGSLVEVEEPPPAAASSRASADERIVLPYEGEGHSLRVQVTFEGPEVRREIPLVFDTGASFTTLGRDALAALGVEVPADAPIATFQTANGRTDAPMVLLPRIWLGSHAIEGVTVAVCNDCAQQGADGLLGLNVTGLFHASIDHELQEVVLVPMEEGGDRHLDVANWLDVQGQVTRWPTGRAQVDLMARNASPRRIERAVVEVECPDRSFAAQIDEVPAHGEASTRFDLPRGTACDSYRVILRTAAW